MAAHRRNDGQFLHRPTCQPSPGISHHMPNIMLRSCPGILTLALSAIPWGAAPGAAPALTQVAVYPPDINLETARDRQSFVVQATFADGITRDVTGEAAVTLANPALVRLEGNTLHPAADGATQMTAAFGGQTV